MAMLWTSKAELSFHKAVGALAKVRQTPSSYTNYRETLEHASAEPSSYILQLVDELQLADHLAFLAQDCEGANKIAAVCIEERQDDPSLVVRLARNKLRDENAIDGVQRVLRAVERCAAEDLNRDAAHDLLFSQVLDVSGKRILQRLLPPWSPAPPQWKSEQRWKRTSLRHRIRNFLLPELRQRRFDEICVKVENLSDTLALLETRQSGTALQQLIRDAVEACVKVSSTNPQKSLEKQLAPAMGVLSGASRKTVAQVDKIARYFHLCKDLAKLARRRVYRTILRRIKVEPIFSPSATQPKGATESCHAHAEVQLVLHYERYPCDPPPRVIGCSKSACFLCDLLIRRHGKYIISSAHGRIYTKWTIPNADWMTSEQVEIFRDLIQAMTVEMHTLVNRFSVNRGGASLPMESRACLPLSVTSSRQTVLGLSTSTLTHVGPQGTRETTLASESPSSENAMTVNSPAEEEKSNKQPRKLLRISEKDLPFKQSLSSLGPELHLRLGKLSLFAELNTISCGALHIRKVIPDDSVNELPRFAVESLSTQDELNVASASNESGRVFRLQMGGRDVVELEVTPS